MKDLTPLLSRDDLANLLGISRSYLDQAERRGSNQPPFIRIGRVIRYERGAVLQWLCDQACINEVSDEVS